MGAVVGTAAVEARVDGTPAVVVLSGAPVVTGTVGGGVPAVVGGTAAVVGVRPVVVVVVVVAAVVVVDTGGSVGALVQSTFW